MASHSEVLEVNTALAARNTRQQRSWTWSIRKASIIRTARTELRFRVPWPLCRYRHSIAEQDFRCVKVKQKISGSFLTVSGIEEFTILRSSVETAQKRRRNAIRDAEQPIAPFGAMGPVPDSFRVPLPAELNPGGTGATAS